jgi:hypothetical protein
MMGRMSFHVFVVSTIIFSFSATAQEIRSSVFVLVDLSETWLAPSSKQENQRILSTAGQSIILAAEEIEPPIAIRYFPIGDESLMRPPLCEAVYDPKILPGTGGNKKVITRRSDAEDYFVKDCVQFILSQPTQDFTDISGAVDTAARVGKLQEEGERVIILLSDLKQELRPGQSATSSDLGGYTVILVYRVLPEDRQSPANLDGRLLWWRESLEEAGAKVLEVPDLAIDSNQLASLISRTR